MQDETGARTETVVGYHLRTRHHRYAYARSRGFLDWATQPDPFLRHPGAPVVPLDLVPPCAVPLYDDLYGPAPPAGRLGRDLVSDLLFHSMALSAWKAVPGSRWSLRVNPSSGNLHPTEAYLLLPELPGTGEAPGLFHYLPRDHALERRRSLDPVVVADLLAPLPAGSFLAGLTSIPWRESWKYGERAYRYCQHDVGHAAACLALAARLVGYRAAWVDLDDDALARLLGIADAAGAEAEEPDLLLALTPGPDLASGPPGLASDAVAAAGAGPLLGSPAPLSGSHFPWPVIDRVAAAARRRAGEGGAARPGGPRPPPPPVADARPRGARRLLRGRRSAVEMDGETALSRAAFLQMVERCLPREGRPPFDVLPWDPAVHPVFFVHRVAGLDPGAYVLVRDPGARALLEATLPGDPSWREVEDAPGVPLFRLRAGDLRGDAAAVSCDQGIAGNGAFAVAMLARFDQLEARGPWFYRALHWEAGALGQVLYLEAEAAGVQGTGIGCFFDEGTHELLGMTPGALRVVYHFTVGGGVHDPRLQTLPAYPARSVDQEGEGEEGDAGEPLGGA